jgi:hypothetical protein
MSVIGSIKLVGNPGVPPLLGLIFNDHGRLIASETKKRAPEQSSRTHFYDTNGAPFRGRPLPPQQQRWSKPRRC